MTIDERAMEAGFEILGAAIHKGEIGKYPEDDWRLFRRAIKAYEAARWRPIEEAPFSLPIILSLPSGVTLPQGMDSDPVYLVAIKHETGLWDQRTGNLWDNDDLVGALFRTIEPPPQK